MSNNLTKIEFFEDKLRIHYYLKKPYGFRDVDDCIEMNYLDIGKLPQTPENLYSRVGEKVEDFVKIYIPKTKNVVQLAFSRFKERDCSPLEEDVHGPFLE